MDAIVGEVLSKWYIYLYEQIGIQIQAPPPSQVFDIVAQLMNFIYDISPPIFRTYYTILNSIPVQTDIIPVALAMLILYALFATIVIITRGLFRLVYGFIRYSIILTIIVSIISIILQYRSIIDSNSMTFSKIFSYTTTSTGTLSRPPTM